MDVRNILDKHTKERFGEVVPRIKAHLDMSASPDNIPGWFAGKDNLIFRDMISYVQTALEIPLERRRDILLTENQGADTLHALINSIHYDGSNASDSSFLVTVGGIETVFNNFNAHYYDQCLVEYLTIRYRENPPKNPKRILVISRLGDSSNSDKYASFVNEARRGSQFRRFIFEF